MRFEKLFGHFSKSLHTKTQKKDEQNSKDISYTEEKTRKVYTNTYQAKTQKKGKTLTRLETYPSYSKPICVLPKH